MAGPGYNSAEVQREAGSDAGPRTLGAGYLFGVPMGDLGWFASLLMGLATGFVGFFLSTFVAIISILIWNSLGHKADFTWSYARVGLPVGVICGVLALGYLGMLWTRRITRKA